MKVVVNRCFGGFGTSVEFRTRWNEILTMRKCANDDPDCEYRKVNVEDYFYNPEEWRVDPDFVALVEEMGEAANSEFSKLVVAEFPDDATDWRMDNYDGIETVWYVLDGKMYSA